MGERSIIELIERLKLLNDNIEKHSDFDRSKIDELAASYSNKSSEFLAGVAGGIFGLSGGIAITAFGSVTFLAGPIGLVLGASLGILYWRGRGQHKLERATKKFRMAMAVILEQLDSLPEDMPYEVRDRLWKMYNKLNDSYFKIIIQTMGDDKSRFNKMLE